MRVILFQPQFQQPIVDGIKRSTIRKSARCKPGDVLSLRGWSGKPYRSKPFLVRRTTCKQVRPIKLTHVGVLDDDTPGSGSYSWLAIELDGKPMDADARMELAHREGFTDLADMTAWFIAHQGLALGDHLDAYLIEWD